MPNRQEGEDKMNTDDNQEKDVIMSDVPKYDEDGTEDDTDEEENESIKDILREIRRDFKAMKKKVGTFEGKLGKTQTQLGKLTTNMQKTEVEHSAYREEIRTNAVEISSEINDLEAAQTRLETN